MGKFQFILQVIKTQLVGDGPLDVPFVQGLQCFFGVSKTPPPTMLYDKQTDKLEFEYMQKGHLTCCEMTFNHSSVKTMALPSA